MIIKILHRIKQPVDKADWHIWFAWHPVAFIHRWQNVSVGGNQKVIVWLRYIERRLELNHPRKWEYRMINRNKEL